MRRVDLRRSRSPAHGADRPEPPARPLLCTSGTARNRYLRPKWCRAATPCPAWSRSGRNLPIHAGPSGKAMLAFVEPAEMASYPWRKPALNPPGRRRCSPPWEEIRPARLHRLGGPTALLASAGLSVPLFKRRRDRRLADDLRSVRPVGTKAPWKQLPRCWTQGQRRAVRRPLVTARIS